MYIVTGAEDWLATYYEASVSLIAESSSLKSFTVRTANDGLAVAEEAEKLRPEVILMDVGMPKLNSLDAMRRIREQPWGKGITVVAMKGLGPGWG